MLDEWNKEVIHIKTDDLRESAFRLGGDEFAVILPHNNIFTCAQFMDQMEEEINNYNSNDCEVKLSAAYASASSKESSDGWEVYKLADERMYERKRLMHHQKECL